MKPEIAFLLFKDFADFPSTKISDVLAFGWKVCIIFFAISLLVLKKEILYHILDQCK